MSTKVNGELPNSNAVALGTYPDTGIPPAGLPPSTIESENPWIGARQKPHIEIEPIGDGKGFCIKKKSHDPINHPDHYRHGTIECIDFIDDQNFPHHEASAIQYIYRARWKGEEIKDLKKAIWHLNRKVGLLEKGNEASR